MPFTGLIAAPHTPFHDDGSLNLDRIPDQCELLVRNGVTGAFVCGTTGEGLSLTSAERRAVSERWMQAADGRLSVIVHAGHAAAAEAKDLAAHAASLGVAAVAGVAPFYHRASGEAGVVEYLAEIARGCPRTPFYFYDIPSTTRTSVNTLQVLHHAGAAIPNFAGVKFSNPDLVLMQECVQFQSGKFDILFGCDEMLLAAWSLGVRGAVGSTYNYLAPLYHKMFKCSREEAIALQYTSVRVVRVLEKFGGLAAGKAMMKLVGVDCGPVRTPLKTVDSAALKAELQNCGLMEYVCA